MKNLIKSTSTICKIMMLLLIKSQMEATVSGLPVGAKYIALGGQVSVTEDVYSVYYNPACVDYIEQQQVAAEYTMMFLGLSDGISRGFFGYGLPTKKYGSFGLYWNILQGGSLYSENVFAFVYSKKRILSYLPSLSLGIRPKVYVITYGRVEVYDNDGMYVSDNDTAFAKNGNSKSVMSLDIGFSYQLAQNYILGLQINDVTKPNISLFNKQDVVVPMKILVGLANVNKIYGLNLDVGFKNIDMIISAGAQIKLLNEKLRLYGSVKYTSRNYKTKSVSLVEPSVGAEFVFDGVNVAYAFNYPISGIDVFGNHTVSISYRFGPVVKLPEDTSALYAKIDNLEQQLKQKDAEIEELKRKLDELLKKPLPKEVKPEVKPPVQPPAEKPQEKQLTPKERYESLWKRYTEMKDQMSFVDRIKTVETIIKQFKGQTDITAAQKELNELTKQKEAMNKELQTSKNYYLKLKSANVPKSELRTVLERIKKKYEGYGLDVNWIDEELKQLE
ncbi:MAG: conjugal transfer protein TraF [Elusimicrobiota bacterium]|nr:conjugal transfer protein TraF [Elusimicrobiota bacterium]